MQATELCQQFPEVFSNTTNNEDISRTNCQQFPEVFSTNNEDIGRTDLITMNIDTGDFPPSTKPYTLALKHCDWVQQ